MSETLVEIALDYAAHGLAAFPLGARSKEPATRRGFYDASTNPATLRRWFGGACEYNIGIRTGMASSGVWVIDVDDDSSLRALESEHGALPATRTSQSSRGIHLRWRSSSPIQCSASRIAPGIDVKGDGGYIVAPPSIHPDGPVYRWVNDAPIGPAPAWLEALTRKRPPPTPTIPPPNPRPYSGAPGAYAMAALEREIEALANTAPGARNHALNRASFSLHQLVAGGELDPVQVERELIAACVANGLMADRGNGGMSRCMATIESGRRAGLQYPRGRP